MIVISLAGGGVCFSPQQEYRYGYLCTNKEGMLIICFLLSSILLSVLLLSHPLFSSFFIDLFISEAGGDEPTLFVVYLPMRLLLFLPSSLLLPSCYLITTRFGYEALSSWFEYTRKNELRWIANYQLQSEGNRENRGKRENRENRETVLEILAKFNI